eukprot:TRINITY_DN9617_c0_g1_i1.p1 TRINITY_DN9617_c0_g1~~TRINITY_DN9617_c0_g1_i1.p1  ORF type:complete len:1300 (+),score=64.13 TRINITY_DN9617_c0_g1_i1:139-4038(+)
MGAGSSTSTPGQHSSQRFDNLRGPPPAPAVHSPPPAHRATLPPTSAARCAAEPESPHAPTGGMGASNMRSPMRPGNSGILEDSKRERVRVRSADFTGHERQQSHPGLPLPVPDRTMHGQAFSPCVSAATAAAAGGTVGWQQPVGSPSGTGLNPFVQGGDSYQNMLASGFLQQHMVTSGYGGGVPLSPRSPSEWAANPVPVFAPLGCQLPDGNATDFGLRQQSPVMEFGGPMLSMYSAVADTGSTSEGGRQASTSVGASRTRTDDRESEGGGAPTPPATAQSLAALPPTLKTAPPPSRLPSRQSRDSDGAGTSLDARQSEPSEPKEHSTVQHAVLPADLLPAAVRSSSTRARGTASIASSPAVSGGRCPHCGHRADPSWSSTGFKSATPSREDRILELVKEHFGDQRPKWTKGSLIGSGTFGKVFRALEWRTGRQLAVKEVELTNAQVLKDLKKEIDVLRHAKHPNVVRYIGLDRVKTTAYILMEYVSGGTIADAVKMFKRLPEPTSAQYTRHISVGVAYLHRNRIVHRDLKGANLLLTSEGRVKLADFGSAKNIMTEVSGTGASVGAQGCMTVRGTPYWMAPEVITEQGHGMAADVWSLGCTIIEMLTGRPPYSGTNQMAAMQRIAGGHRPLERDDPNISDDARALIDDCLRHAKEERPDAKQVRQYTWVKLHTDWMPPDPAEDLDDTCSKAPSECHSLADAGTTKTQCQSEIAFSPQQEAPQVIWEENPDKAGQSEEVPGTVAESSQSDGSRQSSGRANVKPTSGRLHSVVVPQRSPEADASASVLTGSLLSPSDARSGDFVVDADSEQEGRSHTGRIRRSRQRAALPPRPPPDSRAAAAQPTPPGEPLALPASAAHVDRGSASRESTPSPGTGCTGSRGVQRSGSDARASPAADDDGRSPLPEGRWAPVPSGPSRRQRSREGSDGSPGARLVRLSSEGSADARLANLPDDTQGGSTPSPSMGLVRRRGTAGSRSSGGDSNRLSVPDVATPPTPAKRMSSSAGLDHVSHILNQTSRGGSPQQDNIVPPNRQITEPLAMGRQTSGGSPAAQQHKPGDLQNLQDSLRKTVPQRALSSSGTFTPQPPPALETSAHERSSRRPQRAQETTASSSPPGTRGSGCGALSGSAFSVADDLRSETTGVAGTPGPPSPKLTASVMSSSRRSRREGSTEQRLFKFRISQSGSKVALRNSRRRQRGSADEPAAKATAPGTEDLSDGEGCDAAADGVEEGDVDIDRVVSPLVRTAEDFYGPAAGSAPPTLLQPSVVDHESSCWSTSANTCLQRSAEHNLSRTPSAGSVTR